MSQDSHLFLRDIDRACDKIIRYTIGFTLQQFVADERTFDAVLRNLAIIGEAVKQLPEEVTDAHPEIEWRKIARFRDVLVHRYFAVDEEARSSIRFRNSRNASD
jgi:uncharacterized protein with HEPN domain